MKCGGAAPSGGGEKKINLFAILDDWKFVILFM
jgi:hypothetical protein